MIKFCPIVSLSFWIPFLILTVNPATVHSRPAKPLSWEFITEYHSYNKNIVNVSSGIKSVWTNKILTDYQKQENKIQKVHSISSLMEIDCSKREFRIRQDIGYDDKGNVLRIDQYKISEWHSISPLTPVEIVYKKICTTPKKKLKKK
jgi:hypothetical protein